MVTQDHRSRQDALCKFVSARWKSITVASIRQFDTVNCRVQLVCNAHTTRVYPGSWSNDYTLWMNDFDILLASQNTIIKRKRKPRITCLLYNFNRIRWQFFGMTNVGDRLRIGSAHSSHSCSSITLPQSC